MLGKIALYGLSIVGLLLLFMSVFGGSHDLLLYFTYLILILGVVGAVISGVVGFANNPGGAKKSMVTIIAVVVSVIIGFALSSDTVLPIYGDITNSISKWSGVGLITFYSLFIMASGAIVYSAVSRIIK